MQPLVYKDQKALNVYNRRRDPQNEGIVKKYELRSIDDCRYANSVG